MSDQQTYYILNKQTSYQTKSAVGLVTIVVEAGEMFQPLLDDPTNFTNGFTILTEEFLKQSPLFDEAHKLKTIQQMEQSKIDTTNFPKSTREALKKSGHAEETPTPPSQEQIQARIDALLAIVGVRKEGGAFNLIDLEYVDHSNTVEDQIIFTCSDEQFENYLQEFKSTEQANVTFVKSLEDQDNKQPVAPKPTQEEVVKAYVNDPEVKANHLKIATQLRDIFKDGWFSIQDITKKTSIKNVAEATQMMIGVQLFQLCTSRVGGIKNRHQTVFKITLSIEERMKVLQGHKKDHLKQIELIDKEIEKLSNEGAESEQLSK